MPMPVSETEIAMAAGASCSTGCSLDQPLVACSMRILTCPCAVNLKAFDSRFFRICCRRFGSLVNVRGSMWSMSTWNARFFDSAR